MSSQIEELDVAVVGGGMAGVYAAWRLLKGDKGIRMEAHGSAPGIAVFEYSNRIGGRLLSMRLPGVPHLPIELGGMRFLTSHWRVHSLMQRFGLKTRELHVIDPSKTNLYYLRGQHFTAADWDRPAFSPPYRLERGERARSPGELLIEVALKYRSQAEQMRNVGFWNLLLDEYSLEAYQLIRDAGGYESIVGNWSAAEAIPFLLADFDPSLKYLAFNDGYESLPKRLAEEAEGAGAKIRLQHRLHRLDLEDKSIRLTFDTDAANFGYRRLRPEAEHIVRARHVILALPRRSIELLHPDSFLFTANQFRSDVETVLAQPALKIFAAYRRPWWTKERRLISGRSVTDLPLRQCYYWGTEKDAKGGEPGNTNSILMASYNDSSAVEFWAGLARDTARYDPPLSAVPPGVPIPDPVRNLSASARMVSELQNQLRELHGLGAVEDPATAQVVLPYLTVFQDWTQEPFGGGWHFWKIGVNAPLVMQRMQQPVAGAPLYVCGEAWSRQQGWVEGALETTDAVLQTKLGVPAMEPATREASAWAEPDQAERTYWAEARQR
jgi:monoamine oxidase